MTLPTKPTSTDRDGNYPRYVEQMVEEMQRLVPGPRYQTLRYLLDMARLEAKTHAAEIEGRNDPSLQPPPL